MSSNYQEYFVTVTLKKATAGGKVKPPFFFLPQVFGTKLGLLHAFVSAASFLSLVTFFERILQPLVAPVVNKAALSHRVNNRHYFSESPSACLDVSLRLACRGLRHISKFLSDS
jgi:hypothetical protein